jgi:hypothetical protein
VAESLSFTEALRRLGMRPAGGNPATLRKYVQIWDISTNHFDPQAAKTNGHARMLIPLAEVLAENSTYSRRSLKRRLYTSGLKQRECELCG